MNSERIEYDDNAYNVIAAANNLLKVNNVKYRFEFEENPDNDGFDILYLKGAEVENES
jgi:hypothetical protein